MMRKLKMWDDEELEKIIDTQKRDELIRITDHGLPIQVDGMIKNEQGDLIQIKVMITLVSKTVPLLGYSSLYLIGGNYIDSVDNEKKLIHAWCYPGEYMDITTDRHYIPHFSIIIKPWDKE